MKTAMQELVLKLPNEFIFDNPIIILEALKKEKEQIIDAVNNNEKKAVDFCNKAVFEYWQHEGLFDIEKNAGLNYFNEKFNL